MLSQSKSHETSTWPTNEKRSDNPCDRKLVFRLMSRRTKRFWTSTLPKTKSLQTARPSKDETLGLHHSSMPTGWTVTRSISGSGNLSNSATLCLRHPSRVALTSITLGRVPTSSHRTESKTFPTLYYTNARSSSTLYDVPLPLISDETVVHGFHSGLAKSRSHLVSLPNDMHTNTSFFGSFDHHAISGRSFGIIDG
jgi:hypothetical protein